jgi:nicotinate-nucleotide pyrophosphorylase (carboxylating)
MRPSAGDRGAAGLAARALAEDRSGRDRTTRALFDRPVPAEAVVTAQANGVLSGVGAAVAVARALGVTVVAASPDGRAVRPGAVVLRLRGDARRILAGERTILNFLMHASGVASATRAAVAAARRGPRPLEVWATRKTLPGLRDLEKAAVGHGGGRPHRRDLSEAFLIKNNHLAFLPLPEAVRRARRVAAPGERVEVEVRGVRQALAAARAGADALLIDNATPARARAVVRALERAGLRRGRWVELSGGMTSENIARYRAVGADAASLGSVTHSAAALPFHLTLRPARLRHRAG